MRMKKFTQAVLAGASLLAAASGPGWAQQSGGTGSIDSHTAGTGSAPTLESPSASTPAAPSEDSTAGVPVISGPTQLQAPQPQQGQSTAVGSQGGYRSDDRPVPRVTTLLRRPVPRVTTLR